MMMAKLITVRIRGAKKKGLSISKQKLLEKSREFKPLRQGDVNAKK